MKRLSVVLSCGWVVGWALMAQTTFQEQSARLQNINAYLLDFRPATAPMRPGRTRLELVLDINPQPSIDARVGIKDEPLDPPSIVPKVRARFLSRSGLFVGAAYAPGIEFQDYEADYYSVEAGFRVRLKGLHYALRASYSDGDITGPITEAAAKDFFVFENQGLDFSVGKRINRYQLYAFAGLNETDTTLDVESDGARLANTDDTYYGGLGLGYRWGPYTINLEQNLTDDYLKHLIISLSYRF